MKSKVAFLVFISTVCLLPLFLMLVGSVKAPLENLLVPPSLIPANPTLHNYELLLGYPLGVWTLNTLIISGGCALLNVVIVLLFAFGVVFKLGPRGRFLVLGCVVATFLSPSLLLIPRYLLVRSLGLFNTRLGMFLPFVPLVSLVAISTIYMRTFPRYLLDVAEIDGCGPLRQFFSVVMPGVRPIAALIGITSIIRIYDMFMWQILVAPAHKIKTLAIGMGVVVTDDLSQRIMSFPNFSLDMAAATVTFVPMLIVFLLFRGYFKPEALHQGVMR